MTLIGFLGTDDNGPTPLQGQQDEQPQALDTNDIIANYVKWYTNMHDDIETILIDDIDRQEIQRQMRNDTPVKTRDNRQFIDDINSYDRDKAMINRSFDDRIGLGCSNLPEHNRSQL